MLIYIALFSQFKALNGEQLSQFQMYSEDCLYDSGKKKRDIHHNWLIQWTEVDVKFQSPASYREVPKIYLGGLTDWKNEGHTVQSWMNTYNYGSMFKIEIITGSETTTGFKVRCTTPYNTYMNGYNTATMKFNWFAMMKG